MPNQYFQTVRKTGFGVMISGQNPQVLYYTLLLINNETYNSYYTMLLLQVYGW